MPHSLRVKIKNLRRKGIITDKDCERLCKALDNEDELKDLSKRVENIEKQIKEDKEEQLKKLQAELDYAKLRCSLNIVEVKKNEQLLK